MARPDDRIPLILGCVLALLLAVLPWTPATAVTASATCPSAPSAVTTGTTPVLFVHGINSGPAAWTSGTVEGSHLAPLPYVVSQLGADRATGYTFDWSDRAGPPGGPIPWVDDKPSPPASGEHSTGDRLAEAIHCLAQASGRPVVIVAHSMGGLLTKFASNQHPEDIASVFTLGTPFEGAPVADAGPAAHGIPAFLDDGLSSFCWQHVDQLPCKAYLERNDSGITGMRTDASAKVRALPSWPQGLPVYTLAADTRGQWRPVWPLPVSLDLGGVGDLVVGKQSQNPSGAGYTRTCESSLGTSGPQVLWASLDLVCAHWNEPRYRDLLDQVVATVRDHPSTPSPSRSATPVDWNNRTYGLTCSDTVTSPVPVAVRDGKATVHGPGIGSADHWDVQVQQTAAGSLGPAGEVTAVLFYCSPQPSNWYVQEIRVYRTADGTEIGQVPMPAADSTGPELPPQYQPPSLTVDHGRVSVEAKFYGPGDSHASGPSIDRHLSWTWDGRRFTADAGNNPSAGAATPGVLGDQHVTVDGIGPLTLGMSRAQAEQAVGAPIPDAGLACEDLAVAGGPDGLALRFVQDRLVAVSVRQPASVSTASGIKVGSPASAVEKTYAGEVGPAHVDNSLDELVFAPSAARFAGKVIVFDVTGGQVNGFSAGLREWAYLGPCPH
ncbi:esterase/lipase family protein [Kitasatospora sp. NPDC088346]|uniref:esterase/lipase family protein n=1 Tax=Kitasatospora sp. NPDC088346 TaxID=3364073 RepID=UPI00382BDAC8